MLISLTKLRADIYNIVDEIIKTGQPIEIERFGKTLKIIPSTDKKNEGSKLNKLISRPGAIVGLPEEFTHLDWSHEWEP